MNIEAVKSAYRRYARVYDLFFGPIFHPGRKHILEALDCQPGERILEVGLGTGLSLPLYPKNVKVTGIDVSGEMLDIARKRVERDGLDQVEDIIEMDAESMNFPDNSFDKVVAMYVVSVVPDAQKLVDEMRRVCKPGGDIFIVNHFQSENPILKGSETMLAPLSKLVGFRPDMRLDDFVQSTRLCVNEISKTNLFGYWKVLRCENDNDSGIAA